MSIQRLKLKIDRKKIDENIEKCIKEKLKK